MSQQSKEVKNTEEEIYIMQPLRLKEWKSRRVH